VTRLLTDTGPLVAILDADDAAHERCTAYLRSIQASLVTSWPVITEAMHLLSPTLSAQKALLQLISKGELLLEDIEGHLGRIEELMEEYHDVPMDFADASLVALAEVNAWQRVFTLDDDFRVYRLKGRLSFDPVP
jgi:predicted nucleic acid-binding protein